MTNRLVPGFFAAFYTSSVIFYSKGAYVLGTSKTDDIIIAKKYNYVKNGSTNFMVVDTKGRHFKVDNCFFYWNWNKIEDWENLKPLNHKQIVYYSYRVPFLGMYPTIVEFSKLCDSKQSESDDEKRSDEKRSDCKQGDCKQIKGERGEILKHIHL